jgi:hypothetical protein
VRDRLREQLAGDRLGDDEQAGEFRQAGDQVFDETVSQLYTLYTTKPRAYAQDNGGFPLPILIENTAGAEAGDESEADDWRAGGRDSDDKHQKARHSPAGRRTGEWRANGRQREAGHSPNGRRAIACDEPVGDDRRARRRDSDDKYQKA